MRNQLHYDLESDMTIIAGRLSGFGLSFTAYSEPARLGSEVLVCAEDSRPSRAEGGEIRPRTIQPLAFYIHDSDSDWKGKMAMANENPNPLFAYAEARITAWQAVLASLKAALSLDPS